MWGARVELDAEPRPGRGLGWLAGPDGDGPALRPSATPRPLPSAERSLVTAGVYGTAQREGSRVSPSETGQLVCDCRRGRLLLPDETARGETAGGLAALAEAPVPRADAGHALGDRGILPLIPGGLAG